ncbi:MAG: response regulator [Pseudomonadota bacterium]
MDKILIIDDEKPTLAMFRLFLGAYGYEVFTAENGGEGLEVFERERPPIVVTDIKMPGMDGFEVLRRIKEIEPSTEVIIITGHGDMDLAVKALDFNATDFINKPIQRSSLDAALKRAKERLKLTIRRAENAISLRNADDIVIIDIKGDMTSHSEDALFDVYKKASAEGTAKILMHFDEHASINGAGIAILIQLLSESRKKNQVVAISGLSENFKKMFHMVGITKFATIYDREEEAIVGFQ